MKYFFKPQHQRAVWLISSLAISRLGAIAPALGQIIPDSTLPNNTLVTPNGSVIRIEGGTRVGSHLFHSFKEFSVATGDTAFFNNAADLQNIITRVTGGKISNIDGLIRANGEANLFLINPNGLIFGPNASLNIGGSFIGSTASSIKFADGSSFDATNPNAPPLLTINVPIGLQFGQNPGEIQVLGTGHNLSFDPDTLATLRSERPAGLQVPAGNTLALIGGNVTLIGGNVTAEAGRIEIGSVAEGLVTLTPINPGWALGYEGINNFRDIRFTEAASASTSGRGGGSIEVQGRRVEVLKGSSILADTLGNENGEGLTVRASESVEIRGNSDAGFSPSLFSSVDPGAGGNGGNLTVETGYLLMEDGAIIAADTFGSGNAGALNIRANLVELQATTLMATSVYEGASGRGGNLTIATGRLLVESGAQVLTFTNGAGDAGNLSVRANEIEVRGTSASGRFASVLSVSVESGATGNGGKLTIETSSLLIADGAGIGGNTGSSGDAGEITIFADRLELRGTSIKGAPSYLSAASFGEGKGGNLTIETAESIVRDGAQIGTGSFASGDGGNLVVRGSDSVDISGSTAAVSSGNVAFFTDESGQRFPSGLFASSDGTGKAGTLTIETGRLIVGNGGQVSVSARQAGGQAGNLAIAARSILLDRGTLSAATVDGNQGNITLSVRDMQLRNEGAIATNATGTATGGNIDITAQTLTALENSDISANARESKGGRVTIDAQGIFGTEFRLTQTLASDITATGGTPDLKGTVQINTPDINPSSGLVELPQEFRDLTNQIVSRCSAKGGNRFAIAGRGGLPEDPNQTLRGRAVWRDLRAGEIGQREREISSPPLPHHSPIVEATGMAIAPDGKVSLVARTSPHNSNSSWYQSPQCKQ